MDFSGENEIRFKNFKRIWDFALNYNSKFILTGRPNFFANNEELRILLKQ